MGTRTFLVFAIVTLLFGARTQVRGQGMNDSIAATVQPYFNTVRSTAIAVPTILTRAEFLELVRENHPLTRAADLQSARARAVLQLARGGFDPKLYADVSQKYFKGSQYYGLLKSGVKLPTWYGLTLEAGYEDNDGVFLNPEATVPDAGLYNAGVSLTLGRGLFIDERRAALQQANIAQELAVAEREYLLNSILYNAGQDYYEWFSAFHLLTIAEDALELAITRREAIAVGVRVGDRAAIDTLEAGIQVQNRLLTLADAQLDYTTATARLSVYLWVDGVLPLELTDDVRPPELSRSAADYLLDSQLPAPDSLTGHPAIRRYQFEIQQTEIDRRLALEDLKPTVDLSYNLLAAGPADRKEGDGLYRSGDYKWGLNAEFPLFLRKARGKLALTDIKLAEANFKLRNQQAQLEYKAYEALVTRDVLTDQLGISTQNVNDYDQLLRGERRKFDLGESSLFLVNQREQKYLEARRKLVEINAKLGKAGLSWRYALGVLGQ